MNLYQEEIKLKWWTRYLLFTNFYKELLWDARQIAFDNIVFLMWTLGVWGLEKAAKGSLSRMRAHPVLI